MQEPTFPQPLTLEQAIGKLSEQVHQEMRLQLEQRIKSNPKPTEQELVMGTFLEELEPQVREALTIMYEKGYQTCSSGFYGTITQAIDGYFKLDVDTISRIQALGARVEATNDYSYIKFETDTADIEAMRAKWIQIAQALPHTGKPAFYNRTHGAELFQGEYADDPFELERITLERELAHGYFLPEEKEGMERRVDELRAMKT